MRLYLNGHNYKYAVEQMLLTMFPEERPEYPAGKPAGDRMEIRLSRGPRYTTASCALWRSGQVFRGRAAAVLPAGAEPLEADRVRQRLIKNAIYRAALNSGVKKPAWGALTGVRPGKLLAGLLNEGLSEQQAVKAFIREYDVSPARAALCLDTSRETLKAMASLAPRDICLYVGIPFCPTRCAYCSFVSASVEKSFGLMEPYLAALEQEITDAARMVAETGLSIKSFYMGGGTPTTLSAQQMDHLLTHLNKSFDLTNCAEYCIEAGRPDTITREKLQVLLDHGADRISVNPQSMEDEVLRAIGRKHTAADIEATMALTTSMGFPHVNMDLIAGLPADTPEGFRRTLDKCLTFGADNITVHTLSLKKGSRILLEGLPIPSAQDVSAMLDYANDALRTAGFTPYYLYRQKYMSGSFENVGWCISGAEGLYNIYIMEELHSILSLGAGGSTKMVDPVRDRIERVFHPKFPTEYIARPEKIRQDLETFRRFHENMQK